MFSEPHFLEIIFLCNFCGLICETRLIVSGDKEAASMHEEALFLKHVCVYAGFKYFCSLFQGFIVSVLCLILYRNVIVCICFNCVSLFHSILIAFSLVFKDCIHLL